MREMCSLHLNNWSRCGLNCRAATKSGGGDVADGVGIVAAADEEEVGGDDVAEEAEEEEREGVPPAPFSSLAALELMLKLKRNIALPFGNGTRRK